MWQQIWCQGPFYDEKNTLYSLKCGFGIGYGIGRKYWTNWVSVLVSDLNQNRGFGRTLFFNDVQQQKRCGKFPLFVLFLLSTTINLVNLVGISTHCLYRILDSKKTSPFQFSVPGLREMHRNLKQQKNFNFRDGFFRKSPFCNCQIAKMALLNRCIKFEIFFDQKYSFEAL